MNTDFENIQFVLNIFEAGIQFYCIKCEYLLPKWIDSFAKSLYIDDSGIIVLTNGDYYLLYIYNTDIANDPLAFTKHLI